MIAEITTLLGLFAQFMQEKANVKALKHQEFIEWLRYHQHEEVKNLIINNAALATEIDTLLRSDHAKMLQKLDQIGDILGKFLSRVDQFRGLTLAVAPNTNLSEQAISILRQFVESGESRLDYCDHGERQFTLEFDNGTKVEVTDPRFIGDDLNQLVALQVLTAELNSRGGFYVITRNAIRFMEAVDGKSDA
jgi:hypothetical protein